MLRARLNPPRDIFPIDPWAIEVVRFRREVFREFLGQSETVFALANGHLGIRGSHEEDRPKREPGTYLNGCYETRPIVYGEHAYGFPKVGQTILNCPDGKIVKLYVDDEPFDLEHAEVRDFRRRLDMRTGILERDVAWTTAAGKRVRLCTRRLVSLAHRHLVAIDYDLVVEDAATDVIVASELVNRQPLPVATDDPRLGEGFAGRVLHPAGTLTEGLRVILGFATRGSGITLACGMDHVVETTCAHTSDTQCSDDHAAVIFRLRAEPGARIRICKYLGYHYADDALWPELRSRVGWTLDSAVTSGFAEIAARQETAVQDFWDSADVEVEGDRQEAEQQVIRWNLFQLLQASARVEGHGIGARGLTGQTYEGHYFWDTEIYVLPFLIYTAPRIARHLLRHRYEQLDRARARAHELGHPGATFPWRTINGDEASAYYAAGTAQYHINADIVYAVRKYVEVTADLDFLHDYGAEILVETARFWLDLGSYIERHERRFCINGVTGPDEYTAVVNNNYFTNLMARENLRYAAATVRALATDEPDVFRRLVDRTGLGPDEASAWQEAADHMYLPYDERLGIHPQDDSFLEKERWDFANTPQDHYPLLLHYHPLNLYRHQVIKQADTLLAMILLGDQFSLEEKKRNFDYYDPLTTHDSSLSVCIQSILANEIGYGDKAREYFDFAAVMDLGDVGGNMRNGAHIASIGGTWLALVFGFAGMRDHAGRITFAPRLPAGWRRLRCRLMVRGNALLVDVRPDATTYHLRAGEGLTIWHEGQAVVLGPSAPAATMANRPLAAPATEA